jgi:protoporphyrin/coproporphyrin ferrochelatase
VGTNRVCNADSPRARERTKVAMTERIGILLLNLGGPDSPEAIKPFLRNLFADRDIIRLPGGRLGQALIGRMIVRSRLSSARMRYGLIGGKSPLLELTTAQATALERVLIDDFGIDAMVRPAMRYWHPFVPEALDQMEREGIRRIVAVSLYPHYSLASTGSVLKELERNLGRQFQGRFETTVIDRWPALPGYLDVLAARIDRAFATIPAERRDGATLLFSAHGLPMSIIEQGDPYVDDIQTTIDGVVGRLTAAHEWRLSYQSRVGPKEWLGPTTPDTLRALASRGQTDVVIVPISFVTDHLETLVEIDREFAELADELGFRTFIRTDALNDDPGLMGALAGLIREHLGHR